MIARDEFYGGLIENSGTVHFGKANDRIVITWDGINPVLMSFEVFEDFFWEHPDVEVLAHDTIRISQYRFEYVRVYREYNVWVFHLDEFPSDSMPQEYWDRLAEWKAHQGVE